MEHPNFQPRRIAIVGATGSGKSTLASQISVRLGIPHVDMDELNWLPNWTNTTDDEFIVKVQAALSGESWVTAGNYRRVRPIVWGRAELLVWLDYPLPYVTVRLLKRTLRRIITREELWSGNRESFRTQFLHRDSLFLWLFQTHPRHRREYPAMLTLPEYRHLRLLRFYLPTQTQAWLVKL